MKIEIKIENQTVKENIIIPHAHLPDKCNKKPIVEERR
jgi:hypothetical protein